jgi:hypothetical protein
MVMQFPSKINVAIPVSGDVLAACVRINAQVRRLTSSDIQFGQDANSSPHVTIAMGQVGELRQWIRLQETVIAMSKELRSFSIRVGMPYRESETGRYIVGDIIGAGEFRTWRDAVRMATSGLFADEARTSDEPHLTIAHIVDRQVDVDRILEREGPLGSCIVDSIEISHGGPKGRRLEILETMPLSR